MHPAIQQRLTNAQKLPTIPSVVLEILNTCQKDDFCIEDLAKVIQKDPALSIKLLKIVNSPLFGISRTIATISEALVWLGVNAVRTIALSLSVISNVQGDEESSFDYTYFWKRSLLSALTARYCAVAAGYSNAEEAFLTSLLQDIGILALAEGMGEEYRRLAQRADHDHDRLLALEREQLNTHHAEVGAWLAERWSLPPSIASAIRCSHSFADEHPSHDPMERWVEASGWIADIWLSEDVPMATARAYAVAEELLEMDRDAFDTLLTSISDMLPEVSSLFNIQYGPQHELEETLEQASETLMLLSLQSVLTLESRNREIEERSQRDPLTGLYNRAHLNPHFERAFVHATRSSSPLSVLFCDIDYFKTINDTYGHHVGDEVLQGLAQLLERETGSKDVVARFGGEEFVVILPHSNATHARILGERLRISTRNWRHTTTDGQTIRVTLSIGAATHNDQERFPSRVELLEAADKALYIAKSSGRDCVISFDDHNASYEQICSA